ncbi:MAG: hypothetical protein JKY53_01715 [Flavobacteriales bacterium]|nr:hypothetical protein [Flavobacteriales bacterium]
MQEPISNKKTIVISDTNKWNQEAIETALTDYHTVCYDKINYSKLQGKLVEHDALYCVMTISDDEFHFNEIQDLLLRTKNTSFLFLVGNLSKANILLLARGHNVGLYDHQLGGQKDMVICMEKLIHSDESIFCDNVNQIILDYLFNNTDTTLSLPSVNEVEKQIIRCLGEGMSTTDIAKNLNLTNRKVTMIRSNLLERFKCLNCVQLMARTIKLNLI